MDTLHFFPERWIEIDIEAIEHNVSEIKKALQPGVKLMAVVKGDAYGLGSVYCAQAALRSGADMLGVTTIEEGIELRIHGIEEPILVFSPLMKEQMDFIVENSLIPTVASIDCLSDLNELAKANDLFLDFHLKIETGMGRIGIDHKELLPLLAVIKECPHLRLAGIYTHFAKTAHADFTKTQAENLLHAAEICREQGFTDFLLHACASAGFIKFPEYHFDMVRIGTLIYGQMPQGIKANLHLRDPWRLKAKILQIREIRPGTSVGYGRDFIAKKNMKIAIVPIGLADGFSLDPPLKAKSLIDLVKVLIKEILKYYGKNFRASGEIYYNGKSLQIVGRIGMQLLAVDVTELSNLQTGDVVEVLIRRTSASARIARYYFKEGRISAVRSIVGEHNFASGVYGGEKV